VAGAAPSDIRKVPVIRSSPEPRSTEYLCVPFGQFRGPNAMAAAPDTAASAEVPDPVGGWGSSRFSSGTTAAGAVSPVVSAESALPPSLAREAGAPVTDDSAVVGLAVPDDEERTAIQVPTAATSTTAATTAAIHLPRPGCFDGTGSGGGIGGGSGGRGAGRVGSSRLRRAYRVAAARSPHVRKRSSGFLAIALATTASRPGGRSGFTPLGGGAGVWTWA
jgi:hypothetical protein